MSYSTEYKQQSSEEADRKCRAGHVILGYLATLAGSLSFLSFSAERNGFKSVCVCMCVCERDRERQRGEGRGETERERDREIQSEM